MLLLIPSTKGILVSAQLLLYGEQGGFVIRIVRSTAGVQQVAVLIIVIAAGLLISGCAKFNTINGVDGADLKGNDTNYLFRPDDAVGDHITGGRTAINGSISPPTPDEDHDPSDDGGRGKTFLKAAHSDAGCRVREYEAYSHRI